MTGKIVHNTGRFNDALKPASTYNARAIEYNPTLRMHVLSTSDQQC